MGPEKGKSTIGDKEIMRFKQIIIRSDCVFEDECGTILKMLPLFSQNLCLVQYGDKIRAM